MAEVIKCPRLMPDGEKAKIVWEYGLDDLPAIMAQLDCLDRLQGIMRHRTGEIGARDIAFLQLMAGTLRIACNHLLDIRDKTSPRPTGGEGQDN